MCLCVSMRVRRRRTLEPLLSLVMLSILLPLLCSSRRSVVCVCVCVCVTDVLCRVGGGGGGGGRVGVGVGGCGGGRCERACGGGWVGE